MKQLHNLVNIVPVIGKADTLTAAELKKFKVKVRNIECFHSFDIFLSLTKRVGIVDAFGH
jgi:septin family protein